MSLLLNTDYASDSEEENKDRSLVNEARRVVNEIRFGVSEVDVSQRLANDDSIAFINIKTLENEEWCIELTASGYAIVSNRFDSIDDANDNECFETVEALMNRISPKYMKIFNESVAERLKQLV